MEPEDNLTYREVMASLPDAHSSSDTQLRAPRSPSHLRRFPTPQTRHILCSKPSHTGLCFHSVHQSQICHSNRCFLRACCVGRGYTLCSQSLILILYQAGSLCPRSHCKMLASPGQPHSEVQALCTCPHLGQAGGIHSTQLPQAT